MRLLVAALALALAATGDVTAAAPAEAGPPLHTLPGTAWWTETATGRRVVAVDASVSARDVRRLAAGGVTVLTEPGVRAKRLAGGEAIYPTGGFRCTVGFNVRKTVSPYDYYFITSGHCVGPVGSEVRAGPGGTVIGTVVQRLDPRDFALVRYLPSALIPHPSAVNRYDGTLQPIAAFGVASVGQAVQRAGSTTGLRSGVVTAVNATVNYADGRVTGLIRTTVCSEAGDSGGPLFSSTTGLGLASGGSGNCTSGGVTYFAPVTPLAANWSVAPW